MTTRISTSASPQRERFGFWMAMVEQMVAPFEIHSDHTADFDTTIHAVEARRVQVTPFDQAALETRPAARQISRPDPEVYQLALITRGTAWFAQADRAAVVPAGSLVLVDPSRPYTIALRAESGDTQGLTVSIPRGLLPISEAALQSLLVTALPGRSGIGALTAAHLRALLAQAGQYSPLDSARLATVTLDLITALLAHRLDPRHTSAHTARQLGLFERILAFIQYRLADPDLTPRHIAATHHISTRTLERLFQSHGTTPAAWIRTRRLDRCRHDLADPLLHERPIHATAARWGFRDPAAFTRAFRAAYGVSPRGFQLLTTTRSET
ncbi:MULTISPECIES: helix-turn-helix domain-containing protein [unclassified Streptomyces]|uniref:AraC-like ligand-binding domain-containing protein n=1 Tax=unclassified Streptomyces TaxID=2593676 RepID=UPI003D8B5F2B